MGVAIFHAVRRGAIPLVLVLVPETTARQKNSHYSGKPRDNSEGSSRVGPIVNFDIQAADPARSVPSHSLQHRRIPNDEVFDGIEFCRGHAVGEL